MTSCTNRTRPTRRSALAGCIVVVATLGMATPATAHHPAWTPTGSLSLARHAHTATRLPDGRVLVVGGVVASEGGGLLSYPSTETAEVYDPATGTWSPTGSMSVARNEHTATLLADGTVLVAGGYGESSAELFHPDLVDPRTGRRGVWLPVGPMSHARNLHTATLLADGRVLVVAGDFFFTPVPTAEVYDPFTRTWKPTASLATRRVNHTATRLSDGKVLVAGGETEADPRFSRTHDIASVEIYDPEAVDPETGLRGRWQVGGSLVTARSDHTATLLESDKVLVAGGDGGGSTSELYDPSTDTWVPTGSLAQARRFHTATLVGKGRVLVVAGELPPESPRSSVELYDVETGLWETVGSLGQSRWRHTATTLANGVVLAASGGVASAELFQAPHSGCQGAASHCVPAAR